MQTNEKANISYYDYYEIDVSYSKNTYKLCNATNPPTKYKTVVKTLKKIEKALKDKFFCVNYQPEEVLNISKIICESRNLFFFSSVRDFTDPESPIVIQNRIENLIHPSKIFPNLTIIIRNLVLSNLLLCKDINPISLVNREGKQYFDDRILARAKFFGHCDTMPGYFLQNLFKSANKFCTELSLEKYLRSNGEKTLVNIQKLAFTNFFTNLKHDNKPIIHFSILPYPELLQFFINKDTINQKEAKGETPLIRASRYGRKEIVRQLLVNGANVNHTDDSGNTSLHAISKPNYHDFNIVQLLLDHSADINAQNNEGNTPLHMAVKSCNKSYINFLVSKGADLNIYNNNQQRAFSLIFNRAEFQPCKLKHYLYVENRAEIDNYDHDFDYGQ